QISSLKATSKNALQPLQFQLSKPDEQFKIRINPTYFLIRIILIFGLVAIDHVRFNSSIQKPEHRYFTDPNYYLELKP
ncbi:MAG: hypothetical protein ACKPE1_01110, partial [Dolichospermum sp.]